MARKLETQVRKKFSPNPSSQSILLEEYRALQSNYVQQRSEGVTRMNFFITAMSVLLGGIFVSASSSEISNTPYFQLVVIAALIILTTLGYGVYSFLIQRHINQDNYIRGMARIRSYFVQIDPGLEQILVNGIDDLASYYPIARGAGMRRSTEIILGFLIGIAVAVISSYFRLPLETNIMIAVSFAVITALFLEFFARRKLVKVLGNARNVDAPFLSKKTD